MIHQLRHHQSERHNKQLTKQGLQHGIDSKDMCAEIERFFG